MRDSSRNPVVSGQSCPMSMISDRFTIWPVWRIWGRCLTMSGRAATVAWHDGWRWWDQRRWLKAMIYQNNIVEQAAALKAQGKRVALATVVSTWGSSPRPVGSQLVVDETGAMQGSVSGGCIEGAVVHEAMKVMEDGEPRLLSFGVTDDQAWEVGLACGGKVQVYVEAVE